MPEVAHFDSKMNCVYVNSFGAIDLEAVQDSLLNVSSLLKKHQTNRLIVDVRKQEVALQLIDTFTICKDVVATLPSDLKLAYIVCDPPKQSHDFFALMSNCLGHPLEVFFSVDNAKAWFDNSYDPGSNPFYGKVQFPSVSK